MLVAVISDIHDNLVNLEKCLDWCREKRVAKLILCGDTTNIKTIDYLAANFPGEIFIIRGNIELYEETELNNFKNINYLGEIGFIELDNLLVAACHEPEKIKKIKELAVKTPNFIFYGHTHKPWIEKNEGSVIANPGNLANIFHAPTFALLDTATRKLELKILADL